MGATTVDRIRLNDPAAFFRSACDFVFITACAPIFFASSVFVSEVVNAVTWHPHLFSELQRHVTETANANHAHAIRGPNIELNQRIENRDAAAKQRARLRNIDARWNRRRPHPMTSDARGEGPVASDDGLSPDCDTCCDRRQALPTMQTAAGIPAQPHRLTHFHRFRVAPTATIFADRLVSRHKRILASCPIRYSASTHRNGRCRNIGLRFRPARRRAALDRKKTARACLLPVRTANA